MKTPVNSNYWAFSLLYHKLPVNNYALTFTKCEMFSWINFFQSRVGKWCRLRRVFTLDPYLPEYSMVEVNAMSHPKQILPLGCQEWENDIGRPITSFQIMLRFESADYGSFQQRVVFDFDEQPYVFRQLGVVVAPELNLLHTIQYPVICEDDSELSWLSKYTVVPFDPQDTQGTLELTQSV